MSMVREKMIMVPMRDGIKLATDVYRPAEKGPWPVLLTRLMYDKNNAWFLNLNLDLARAVHADYAVVVQDVRGRYASEGEFPATFQQEVNDGADTITWIAGQSWCSGKVGMFGGSHLGITQWLAAGGQPEALQALAPMITPAIPANYFGAGVPRTAGGAFPLGVALSWALTQVAEGEAQRRSDQGRASQEMMDALLQAQMSLHQLYERLPLVDMPALHELVPSYVTWVVGSPAEAARVQEEHYQRIQVPALNIGGWYDLFLDGTLENYRQMKRQGGSERARTFQRLLIGPWAHMNQSGVFAERSYGPQASLEGIDLNGVVLRWHDHWLKGIDNGVEQDKPVRLFVMGIDAWREEESWPLPDTQYRSYYLHSQGYANTASGDGELSTRLPGDEPADTYCYDPHDPVPTVGGATSIPIFRKKEVDTAGDHPEQARSERDHARETRPKTGFSRGIEFNVGPRDQRQIEQRDDVLCYTTPPLAQAIEVTGPIELVLYVASSARDTDFTGKLVDVHADGRAEILVDGILRARYRQSLAAPVFMEPGQIYELHLHLGATSNVFKAGHCIRLEVSSSNFPRFERNTNTGGTIATETAKDFVQAINRIYHDSTHSSSLILPLLEREVSYILW
jgi:putative CocE/NonD family hydrolase